MACLNSRLCLAFCNDERVFFLHLDWLEGACICPSSFFFLFLFLFPLFTFLLFLLLLLIRPKILFLVWFGIYNNTRDLLISFC